MKNNYGISLLLGILLASSLHADSKPVPVAADVSYGPHPHQLVDIYVPATGSGPFPVLVWYGGIWEPAKHVPDLNRFLPEGIAVIGVETRTLTDGMNDKAVPPVSCLMNDACRVVQFVRLNAAKWNLDPQRIAAGGSSQGALPALFVGGATDYADPTSGDPVARVSSRVTCVAAHRSQPSIDPKRMQEWVPGVKWGAPALGCGFEESLKRRDELLPFIEKWSPDALLRKGAAPVYFENNWGLTQPENVTEADYKVHSPAWGLGFQKLAQQVGVVCHVKFPEHPTDGYKDVWDFIVQELKPRNQPAVFAAPPGQELLSNVVFGTGGGRDLHAEILRPKEPLKEPMPAVLIIHGGGWSGGNHLTYAPWLVQQGYFTASIEYRLSGEAPWPAQIEDCKLAVRWLRANAAKFHVNPDRIGVMGHSAGGHLVACLGTLGDAKELEGCGGYDGVSSRVQAVVDQSGPADFTPEGGPAVGTNRTDHPMLVKLLGGTYAEKTAVWRQASPALHAGVDAPPFLIVHGEKDTIVPVAQGERLAAALKRAGAKVELLLIKNGGHGLRADKPDGPPAEPDQNAQQAAIIAFFDNHVKR